jgi:hypothetical protein
MAQFNISNPNYGFSGTQLVDGGYALHTQPSEKTSDNFGRQKVTIHENVYEADFEYGLQPLRWESLLNGSSSIQQISSLGGVQMFVGTGSNDIAVRQSRPYQRYQPGKTMYMSANANFGGPVQGNFQRVGFFDDSNGAFFEQGLSSTGNPYGMYVCVRNDGSTTGSLPTTTRIPLNQWNGDQNMAQSLNWLNVQMIWIEYAWYGAGTVRFGVTMNSEQYVLHSYNTANLGQLPWARTGNLPVRYEIRNSGSFLNATTLVTSSFQDGSSFQLSGSISGTFFITSSATAYIGNVPPKYYVTFSANPTTMYNNIAAAVNASASVFFVTASVTVSGSLALSGSLLSGAGTFGTNVSGGFGLNFSYVTASISQPFQTITAPTNFYHYGVSVIIEGGRDAQRGFTYSYGLDPMQPRRRVPNGAFRYPVLSIQNRVMGTQEYTGSISSATTSSITTAGTPWATNQWLGKSVYISQSVQVGRIISNTNNTINFVDQVTGLAMTSSIATSAATNSFTLGLINRGQILPQSLIVSADNICTMELISSTPNNPIVLTGSLFQPLSQLGSPNSFATRDISATGLNSGSGEVVYAFVSPAGGSGLQIFDLTDFFPLYNTIRGNLPDILTLAITTSGSITSVGAHLVGQEAMS